MSAQQQPQPLDDRHRVARGNRTQVDALRFWLASGLHKFAVDPRRRLGAHARARQLLSEDHPPAPASSGGWRSLASTLDRHTVLGGMTELRPDERRVILLAYMEGRTNGEIAAELSVSVGTVRRRLQVALERLDAYLGRTGTWLFLILLLGAGYVVGAAMRLGRSVTAIGTVDWTYKLASTAAVSVTAAAIGVAAVSPDSTIHRHGLAPATVRAPAASPDVAAVLASKPRSQLARPSTQTITVMADQSHGLGSSVEQDSEQATGDRHANHGCGHKPTDTPPKGSDGSSEGHQDGGPGSHPPPGGCNN